MQYRNPIIPGFHPDPSICRVGEDYYIVTSSFEFFPGLPVFHSRDLVHWRQIGHVLTRESQLDLTAAHASGGLFAPTIRYARGRFWVINTNVSHGGNFIVHAEHPEGPWSDPIWIDHAGIDPSLLFDDDGKVYYTGTMRREGEEQCIALFEIDPETGEKLSETRGIWKGTGLRCPEAPHLYRIDGWYFLMIAEGGTEYGHCVTVARSRSPWGPYESCPFNPILTHMRLKSMDSTFQGLGHADMVQLPDGSWWAVFLGHRLSESYFHHLGRETFMAPVLWRDGWPLINGGETILPVMEGPNLPERTEATPNAEKWGYEWNFLRNPREENYTVDGDTITLTGTPVTLFETDSPTFIGRRQEQFTMTCRVKLWPLEAEKDSECGLTVFYNQEHHFDVFVGNGCITLRKCVGDIVHKQYSAPWSGPVTLRIDADRSTYRFYYGADDDAGIYMGSALTRHVSTESTHLSFTGVYLAMYAVGTCRARFQSFVYTDSSEGTEA